MSPHRKLNQVPDSLLFDFPFASESNQCEDLAPKLPRMTFGATSFFTLAHIDFSSAKWTSSREKHRDFLSRQKSHYRSQSLPEGPELIPRELSYVFRSPTASDLFLKSNSERDLFSCTSTIFLLFGIISDVDVDGTKTEYFRPTGRDAHSLPHGPTCRRGRRTFDLNTHNPISRGADLRVAFR